MSATAPDRPRSRMISLACAESNHDQCDGRVVIDYDVYPCQCRTCDHQSRGDAA